MHYKLKSAKLWVLIVSVVIMIVLTYVGKIQSGDFTSFFKWAIVTFTAGNVGTKIAGSMKKNE